jgi:hypothetical protein
MKRLITLTHLIPLSVSFGLALTLCAISAPAQQDCMSECMHEAGCWGGGNSPTGCAVALPNCQAKCRQSSQKSYGAIAYSKKTKTCGWSYDWGSQQKAEQVAVDNCSKHGPGCEVIVWYANNCGAVAVDGTIVTWGTDWTKQRAGARALDQCKKTGGKKCELQTAQCSGT